MSKRKDIQHVTGWAYRGEEFDRVWELGRVAGIREAAGKVTEGRTVYQIQNRLRAHARKLRKRLK